MGSNTSRSTDNKAGRAFETTGPDPSCVSRPAHRERAAEIPAGCRIIPQCTNLCQPDRHGLIHENYIKSEEHWEKFTSYFGSNGYFNPKSKYGKDKSHQLTLPDWAKRAKYSIRKMGSKIKPSTEESNQDNLCIEEKQDANAAVSNHKIKGNQ